MWLVVILIAIPVIGFVGIMVYDVIKYDETRLAIALANPNNVGVLFNLMAVPVDLAWIVYMLCGALVMLAVLAVIDVFKYYIHIGVKDV